MAVEIPRLKRMDIGAPERTPRYNLDVPDLVTPMAHREKAMENLGQVAFDYADKIELDAADTEAVRRTNEYETAWRTKFENVRNYDGDPHDVHAQFEDDMTKEYKRLTEDENLTGRARDIVMKRLQDKTNDLEMQRLHEYGQQNYKYQENVTKTAVQLEKANLTTASEMIDPARPETFSAFDKVISNIRQLRLRNGMKIGTVLPDQDKPAPGMVEQGNIDLSNRPRVKNADGSVSTVRSMSVNIDGKEVLIPTVSEDGRIMENQEAVDQYRKTGRHLGKFGDPESATKYAQNLHNDQADMLTGTKSIYVDDDGNMTKVRVTPMADYQLKKDLAEGISNAIENVLMSGAPNAAEAAEAMRAKYGDLIDGFTKKNLTEKFESRKIEGMAYSAVEAVAGKSPDQIDAAFAKLPPKVKDKAYEIVDDRQRRQENMRKRQSELNYDKLANHVIEKMKSDNPFMGKSELEADPVFKNTINRVTDPAQREKIYKLVDAPKVSTKDAKVNIQNLIFGKDPKFNINQVDPETFNSKFLPGLSPADQKKYTTLYENMRGESGAEEARKYRAADAELEKQLVRFEYVKYDQFHRLSGVDELDYLDAREEFQKKVLDAHPGAMTSKEIRERVEEFARTKASGAVFSGGKKKEEVPQRTFQLDGMKKKEEAPLPQKPEENNSVYKGFNWFQWSDKFKAGNKRAPTNRKELKDWIDTNFN